METVGTYTIGLDTPIHMLTPRQLFEMQAEWMSKYQTEQPQSEAKSERWYVNSIEDLAKVLGTSPSTIYRMKREGLLDEAISQCGRWMCINVDKVIEKFRLSNRGKRKKR